MPIAPLRCTVPLSELSGAILPQNCDKVAETVSHKIVLASNQNGRWVPDLQFFPKTVNDPQPVAKYFNVPELKFGEVKSTAAFERLFTESWQANSAHVIPKKDDLLACFPQSARSHYAYNNVVGRRIERFFDEAIDLCKRCPLEGAEGAAARKMVNDKHRDAYRGRAIQFDNKGTDTYWSYSHDSAFVHVYEKILQVLPSDSPMRKVFQSEIDYIFLKKFTPSGEVNEADIERSLGLIMIDKNSRQTVNVKSNFGGQIEYVTASGKPIATDDITFRRPIGEEKPRANMVFDWNRDRMIGKEDTGWFGHCDIKAAVDCLMATMHESGGVIEYRSDTQRAAFLSKDLLLEALASVMECSDTYVSVDRTDRMSLGSAHFGGARFDQRPATIAITTSLGYKVSLPFTLAGLSKAGQSAVKDDLNQVFSTYTPDHSDLKKMTSFSANPSIIRTENGDINYVDATNRQISGTFEGNSFNANGQLVPLKTKFAFSLAQQSEGLVLLGSMESSGAGKQLIRYYYNSATKELVESSVSFSKSGDTYSERELPQRSLGKISSMEIGKEVENSDGVPEKLAMLKQAMASGIKIAADHDTGVQVWNGEIHGLREDVVYKSPDGKWEKVQLHVEGTFGKQPFGVVLHQLDPEGNIVKSYEALAPVDFYWDSVPRIAPLIWGQNKKWYLNEGMLTRGLIRQDDLSAGLEGVRYLYDLIHIGLNGKDGLTTYSIAHAGERLMYNDQRQWLRDVSKVSGGGDLPDASRTSLEAALHLARSQEARLA